MSLCTSKFIFISFLVSFSETLHLFKKLHRIQHQNKLHTDFRILQHNTDDFMSHIKLWANSTQRFLYSFSQNSSGWIFSDPSHFFGCTELCEVWKPRLCLFQNPTKQWKWRSRCDLWWSERRKAAFELHVCECALWTRLSSQRWKPPSTGLTNNGSPGRPPCLI